MSFIYGFLNVSGAFTIPRIFSLGADGTSLSSSSNSSKVTFFFTRQFSLLAGVFHFSPSGGLDGWGLDLASIPGLFKNPVQAEVRSPSLHVLPTIVPCFLYSCSKDSS